MSPAQLTVFYGVPGALLLFFLFGAVAAEEARVRMFLLTVSSAVALLISLCDGNLPITVAGSVGSGCCQVSRNRTLSPTWPVPIDPDSAAATPSPRVPFSVSSADRILPVSF